MIDDKNTYYSGHGEKHGEHGSGHSCSGHPGQVGGAHRGLGCGGRRDAGDQQEGGGGDLIVTSEDHEASYIVKRIVKTQVQCEVKEF